MQHKLSRRNLLITSSATVLATHNIFTPAMTNAQMAVELDYNGEPAHNIFSYRYQDWADHFTSLRKSAVLADIQCRCLHFWHENGKIYKIFPTSVPLTEELTKRGNTKVTQKIVDPVW